MTLLLADPLDDLVQFVEQFLRSPKTKSRDKGHSAVFEGFEQDRFEPLHALLTPFVDSVPVSAFHDQHVGTFGRHRWIEDRRASRAKVTAETDPGIFVSNFDDRCAQNVSCGGESKFGIAGDILPFAVRDRMDQFGDRLK